MSPVVEQILQQIEQLSPAEQTQILQRLSQSPNIIPKIEKTPGVVGGDACIAGTRLPVWELVQYRNYSGRGKGWVPRKTRRNASRTSMPCFLRVEM